MPRIPYVYPEPGECPAADKMRERRKDGKLIGLDGVFLNAPAIAAGFSSLLGAVRRESSLDDDLRELLVRITV
jgi:4-carboxymuconolactone decarboxylase